MMSSHGRPSTFRSPLINSNPRTASLIGLLAQVNVNPICLISLWMPRNEVSWLLEQSNVSSRISGAPINEVSWLLEQEKMPLIFAGAPINEVSWLSVQTKLPPTLFGAPINEVSWFLMQKNAPLPDVGAPTKEVSWLSSQLKSLTFVGAPTKEVSWLEAQLKKPPTDVRGTDQGGQFVFMTLEVADNRGRCTVQ